MCLQIIRFKHGQRSEIGCRTHVDTGAAADEFDTLSRLELADGLSAHAALDEETLEAVTLGGLESHCANKNITFIMGTQRDSGSSGTVFIVIYEALKIHGCGLRYGCDLFSN